MNAGSDGLRRWTRRFTVASAGSLVVFLVAVPETHRSVAVSIGLFGFVCPMIFGMAYLLLPPYVGATLVDYRLAGVHFVLAYVGAGLVVWSQFVGGAETAFALGALIWSLGIAVFLGSLLWTVGSTIRNDPTVRVRTGDRPRRSTRLATAAIPVALGYLVVGTVGLLATAGVFGASVTFPQVVHYYAVGFGALLVFALGARLLIGFFHVRLPRSVVRLVLLAGALAPAGLGAYLWIDPWFRIGAVLAAIATTGYLVLVALVVRRTDRTRVGLSGILLGAIAGVCAVGASLPVAFGVADATYVTVHGVLVLGGFFPLTIVGYAYLFFPVADGRFPGASARTARTTIALLGAGVGGQALGLLLRFESLRSGGTVASVLGAVGYAYLLARRFSYSRTR